jgi:hypothetical protein
MAARRTVDIALREKDDLLEQNRLLTETAHRLATTGEILTSCLTAKHDARVCLHEHYSGTVSEIVGEQIIVVYETQEGESIKQVYDHKQFVPDRLPREGDEVCAYVFVTRQVYQSALPEPSPRPKDEPDFSGFDKGMVGDVEI